MKPKSKEEQIANWWADWLLDAIATATQDRKFLKGDQGEDTVITQAIILNARHAIRRALEDFNE